LRSFLWGCLRGISGGAQRPDANEKFLFIQND